MTITDIENMDKDVMIPSDIAPLFHTDPHSIRVQAHDDPESLGFNLAVIGSRIYIPRQGFINWWYGRKEELS